MDGDSEPRADASDRRLRLRFALGAVALGAEWLTTHLRAWNRELHDEGSDPPRIVRRPRASLRVLGALVELSERRTTRPRSRGLGGIARGVRGSAARVRRRVEARLDRWHALGRIEATESRDLARIGLQRTTERALDWLSGQPALREMVAEQSMDLSRTMLDEVRDATQAGDARADSVVRRLVGSLRRRGPVRAE